VGVDVVLEFIKAYKFHEEHDDLRPDLLQRYIEAQVKQGQCSAWTVCVVARDKVDERLGTDRLGTLGTPFNLVNRSRKARPVSVGSVDLGTMSTQTDFVVGLEAATRTRAPIENGKTSRRQLNRHTNSEPLLLLYPVSKDSMPAKPGENAKPIGAGHNILGVAFAFPEIVFSESDVSHVQYEHDYIHVRLPQYM